MKFTTMAIFCVVMLILVVGYQCTTIVPAPSSTVYETLTASSADTAFNSTTMVATPSMTSSISNTIFPVNTDNNIPSITPATISSTRVNSNVVLPTLTSNVTSSVIVSNNQNVTTTPTEQNTTSTTPRPTIDTSCNMKQSWQPDFYRDGMTCLTPACAEEMFKGFELYLKCNDWVRPEEPQVISYSASDYILLRAKEMIEESGSILMARITERKDYEHFTTEYGFLRQTFHLSHSDFIIEFSEYNVKDHIKIPPLAFSQEMTSFEFTVFKDIYRTKDLIKYQPEITALRSSLEKLPDEEDVAKKEVLFMLNSNIVTFTMFPPKTHFREYMKLRLYLKDPQGTTNHRCVRMIGDMAYWTDSRCYPHLITETFVDCLCDSFSGRYAILSDEAGVPSDPDTLEKDTLGNILMIIALAGIGSSIASTLLPYIMKCSHLGGMLRIYKVSDFTYAVYCLIFFMGVLKSGDVETVNLIAAALNFLHHACVLWNIAEGVHMFHLMSPLYSDAIGMLFFYATFSFGFSAALAGAAMGYDYQFTGTTQFVWPFATGSDAGYMFIPTIGMVLLQVAVNLLIWYELLSWIGTKYDYVYTRSISFIKRSTGYTLTFCATHFLGVSAMQRNGTGAFPYLFLGLFGVQVICMFYHHCFSNIECWSYREEEQFKKELEAIKSMREDLEDMKEGNYTSSSEDETSDDDEKEDYEGMKKKKDFAVINIEPDGNSQDDEETHVQSVNSSSDASELPTQLKQSETDVRTSPTLPVNESMGNENDLEEPLGALEEPSNNLEKPSNESDENSAAENPSHENHEYQPEKTEDHHSLNKEQAQSDEEQNKQPEEENNQAEDENSQPSDEANQLVEEHETEERPPSQASIASTISTKSTDNNEPE